MHSKSSTSTRSCFLVPLSQDPPLDPTFPIESQFSFSVGVLMAPTEAVDVQVGLLWRETGGTCAEATERLGGGGLCDRYDLAQNPPGAHCSTKGSVSHVGVPLWFESQTLTMDSPGFTAMRPSIPPLSSFALFF